MFEITTIKGRQKDSVTNGPTRVTPGRRQLDAMGKLYNQAMKEWIRPCTAV